MRKPKRGRPKTHGGCCNGKYHPLYSTWSGMKQRCRDTNRRDSKHYSLKGVHVCKRWLSFKNFLEDMEKGWKPGLTLHRKNGSKVYGPRTTVWANWKIQNIESEHARILSLNGETMSSSEWSKKLGGAFSLVSSRLRAGWTIRRCLTTRKMRSRYS